MKYTIKELLKKYHVIIPQLQRDYAQGRESENELRKNFIQKIKRSLEDDSEILNLDFIYGYTEPDSSESIAFIPLDGQQRLTTLWLVLWFLSPREEKIVPEETQKILQNFTYETRLSSKRFCLNLVSQPIDLQTTNYLSKRITNAPWFMASWENDPTIISMLNMIDTLQEVIYEKENAWENLTVNNKITFDYIDIKAEEFKLTDELYIKMNSRGKPLTRFENFKAQFSSLLSSDQTNYKDLKLDYEESKITFQQYFAFKIDSSWMDLFWTYRSKAKIKTDDCIDNYINFIAEFLFYKDNPKTKSSEIKIDFEFLNNVFAKKKNICFLFNSLDWLSNIKNIESFFKSLFINLKVFDNGKEDYFYRAISNTNFEVKDKVILYTILQYSTTNSTQTVDEGLKDLTRIVRNLLLTVRQPNQSRRTEYTSNLRLTDVSEYCKFIDAIIKKQKENRTLSFYQILAENEFTGFAKAFIQNEKTKAKIIFKKPHFKSLIFKLEEHKEIQGNTANFNLVSNDLETKVNAFYDIWSGETPTSLIIRSLLTINDYSVNTHNYSALGQVWCFGSRNAWNRILTAVTPGDENSLLKTLEAFLTVYIETNASSVSEKLDRIIKNYKSEQYDWLYYFIKYNTITDNSKLNVFTWKDTNGFNINSLGNSGNYPLHSYHMNPFINTVFKLLESDENIILSPGRFSELSKIVIGKHVEITLTNKGWKISTLEDFEIQSDFVKKHNLEKHNDEFIFLTKSSKDTIKEARELIKDLVAIVI